MRHPLLIKWIPLVFCLSIAPLRPALAMAVQSAALVTTEISHGSCDAQ